ncbi:hypothetical protein A2765_02470 [Candidatus Kaiserbacteria bacterium RIFCSPHIGHO2_01_FULL_56_24]|uniref:Uncharacterized protein n=1 Tax=Candidatus Kaiserbacteria bacterium RIFCSPHIGHO2_01_FULL_56_24 TaxID=1798487 RepID=A0A1F6DAY2_9BACT|nr:MAG: hypothetical protein A2765_02470 [Candidatus Kaiserbacteria bacterium RIFCSPHIGHO2_01_FULL_56_24]
MRGASIVGAVFILAFLSVTAITLDALSLNNSVSQTAATAATAKTPDATSGAAKEESPITRECQIGYDYVVKLNNDGVPTIYIADAKESDQIALQPTVGNRCPNKASSPDSAPIDGTASDRLCHNTDPRRWYCQVTVCKKVVQKILVSGKTEEKTVEKCMLVKKKIPVGKALDAKEEQDGANKAALDTALTSKSAKEVSDAKEFLSGGTSSSNEGVLQSFKDQQATYEAQKKEADAALIAAQEKRAALIKSWGISSTTCKLAPDDIAKGLPCYQYKIEVAAADKEVAAAVARKEELAVQSQRLAEVKVVLQPSSVYGPANPNSSGPSSPSEIANENSSISTTFGSNNPGPGTGGCAPNDFYCIFMKNNTGQPGPSSGDVYACQHNDQAACMRVSGGPGGAGAYGGYGAYPSGGNQPCGAQQQQGGLIGTIISLFKKSNASNGSGCVNGVPVPSCTLTASPTNIAAGGQSVQLSWQSQNAYSATLSNTGSVAVQGSTTVTPQTTTTYTLSLGGYVDNQTGRQLQGQCATQVTVGGTGGDSSGGTPKAQISCQPQTADVGMSVALSFACQNSLASSGTGFSTGNQMSGSATPVITAPTIGSDTVTYGLTCSNQGKTDTAQCTVQINKVSIVLIANPKNVKAGGEANIGWITSGMDSCVISSPTLAGFTAENANNTDVSGVAKTPQLSQDAAFLLSCTTKAGGTKTASTTVQVN